LSLLLWTILPVFSEFGKILLVKYHSNSNFFTSCRFPRLLRLIWAKAKLALAQISLKRRGNLQDVKKFEFKWVKIALDWAIMRLHFASAMKGEINQLVPYESLKWFWTIAVGTQRYLWVLVILWDPGGPSGTPPGVHRGPERVSEESNDTRHVGYQFSQFSTLKTNTGSTHH